MPALDALVQETLSGLIDESMDQTEMLRAIYDYTVDNFTYLKGSLYDFRDTSWLNDEAYGMLSTGYGNCYGYAAALCQLARALGFDACVYSGKIGIADSEHGWVEMDIDGQTYVFDPEMEMAFWKDQYQTIDMFMMTYEEAARWHYTR